MIRLRRTSSDHAGNLRHHRRRTSPAKQHPSTGPGRRVRKIGLTINWQSQQATCPTGAVSRYWTVGLDNNGRDAIRIRFATTTCAPCTVRDQCTRSNQYGRQLTVRPQDQDALLERVRAEQNTEEWKAPYAARAGVEGTIHQAVAVSGIRHTRYRGLAKTHLGHVLTATAIKGWHNLHRLHASATAVPPNTKPSFRGSGGQAVDVWPVVIVCHHRSASDGPARPWRFLYTAKIVGPS
ncbi:transposase [Streptomyces sp. NPDC047043]|uniref:transposase n=1 Tax=Streptomyces sp. NPDC047043 TaxID=3154497 RepID=UPI0033E9E83C